MKNLLFILLLLIPVLSFSQKVGRAGGTGGLNLANLDQYLAEDRLISGANLYNLTIDSLTQLDIFSPEVFITNGPTSLLNIIGTTTRWNTDNSGFIKFNDLGTSGLYMQEVYNDSIFRVYTTQGAAGLQAFDREGAGITYYGGDISVKPNEVWTRVYDPSNITDAEVRVGFGRVQLYGADSLVIDPETFNESLTVVMAIDTATGRNYRKTISPLANQWYTAGNGGSVVANTPGTTFTRTSSTIGTFNVPSGIEPSEFIIYHNTSQNPGTTYKVRINYAGSVTYNNNFNDIRPPEVHIGNATAVVANGGVATNTFRYTYSVTTGSVNLEKSITGFIDDVGYFELTLDNVDDAGGSDDIIISVKF